MRENLSRAAQLLAGRKPAVALTGAGISVESGIPDFRSAGGLWTRYSPHEYATLQAFESNPAKVWRMLREMDEVVDAARPNPAHQALARLEEAGIIRGIITQNIDGLHQAAGSRHVVEFHGSHRTLTCLACGQRFNRDEARTRGMPPPCRCGTLLKPDVVFFGEAIPMEALDESQRLARGCGVMLVVGTSAEVAPASHMPWLAKNAGAVVVEVNIAPSTLTASVTDIFLKGPASEVMKRLVEEVMELGR